MRHADLQDLLLRSLTYFTSFPSPSSGTSAAEVIGIIVACSIVLARWRSTEVYCYNKNKSVIQFQNYQPIGNGKLKIGWVQKLGSLDTQVYNLVRRLTCFAVNSSKSILAFTSVWTCSSVVTYTSIFTGFLSAFVEICFKNVQDDKDNLFENRLASNYFNNWLQR